MIDRIRAAAGGTALATETMRDAVCEVMAGDVPPAQVAALLVALALKGETPGEIAGAALAMRSRAVPVRTHRRPIVDVCGTGGDASGTFNISTCVALVVAGAGVAVAKHGNRAMSSRCGSADVLEALGVDIEAPPDVAARSLDREGIAFLFAQAYHPAMRNVAPIRREIGIRTLFNVIGPLSNPAGAHRQVVGVARPEAVPLMAAALAELGAERAAAVHGDGGIDELSLSGPSRVTEWTGAALVDYAIHPSDIGLPLRPLSALAGGDVACNARIIRDVLAGSAGAPRDAVILNAALALVIAEAAEDLRDGARTAERSIDSGAAAAKLEALVRESRA